MSSVVITICSAVVALAGLVYLFQGLRAERGTAERGAKVLQGTLLILMVGSNVLPMRLSGLRDLLVVGGCLTLLYSIVSPRRSPAEVPEGAHAPLVAGDSVGGR